LEYTVFVLMKGVIRGLEAYEPKGYQTTSNAKCQTKYIEQGIYAVAHYIAQSHEEIIFEHGEMGFWVGG
jgi:hypothetical protein